MPDLDMQVNWAHLSHLLFGLLLMAFVMVLTDSSETFLSLFLDAVMDSFLAEHV